MRKVQILEPVDGYAKGDTPTLPGPRVRELVDAGKARRLPKEDETDAATDAKPKGKRR